MIVIMLFVLFVLPQWVNRFYYNPAAVVGTGQYGTETNRGSLDMAVYTELFIPDGYRDKMLAESDGYGEYSVYVPQTFSCNGRFTDTVGKITRGKLTLYNPNLLKRPSVNHFVVSMSDFHSDFIGTGAAGSRSDAFAALRELGAEDWYTAYVTFDRLGSNVERRRRKRRRVNRSTVSVYRLKSRSVCSVTVSGKYLIWGISACFTVPPPANWRLTGRNTPISPASLSRKPQTRTVSGLWKDPI